MVQDIKMWPSGDGGLIPRMRHVGSGASDPNVDLNILGGSQLSWESDQGQIFSLTNELQSGVIFGVKDISGLPHIEVNASGEVDIGEYSSKVTAHLDDNNSTALDITEGSNSYMKFDTTDSAEKIIIGKTLYSATNGDITIKAEGDMIFQVDADNDTSESFSWLNGGGTERMNLSEAGDLQVDGDLDLGARYIGNTKAYTGQGGSVTVDATKANYFTVATTSSITGLDITNAEVGQKIVIRFAWGGTHTLAHTDTVIWPGGTSPTNTANGGDVYGFICTTASTHFDGYIIGQDLK